MCSYCKRQFESLSTWRFHTKQWKDNPLKYSELEKQINSELPISVLSKKENSCYSIKNLLRYNGPIWRNKLWNYWSALGNTEEIRSGLIFIANNQNRSIKYFCLQFMESDKKSMNSMTPESSSISNDSTEKPTNETQITTTTTTTSTTTSPPDGMIPDQVLTRRRVWEDIHEPKRLKQSEKFPELEKQEKEREKESSSQMNENYELNDDPIDINTVDTDTEKSRAKETLRFQNVNPTRKPSEGAKITTKVSQTSEKELPDVMPTLNNNIESKQHIMNGISPVSKQKNQHYIVQMISRIHITEVFDKYCGPLGNCLISQRNVHLSKYYFVYSTSSPEEMLWILHTLGAETEVTVNEFELMYSEEELYIHPKYPYELRFPERMKIKKWQTLIFDFVPREQSISLQEKFDQSIRRNVSNWYTWKVATNHPCNFGVPIQVFLKWGALTAKNRFNERNVFLKEGLIVMPFRLNPKNHQAVISEDNYHFDFRLRPITEDRHYMEVMKLRR
jgi:hypothetical protein